MRVLYHIPEEIFICLREKYGKIRQEVGKNNMKKYKCIICGYVYDPEQGDPDGGIAAGTAFENIPDSWVCPVCGVGKDQFEAL